MITLDSNEISRTTSIDAKENILAMLKFLLSIKKAGESKIKEVQDTGCKGRRSQKRYKGRIRALTTTTSRPDVDASKKGYPFSPFKKELFNEIRDNPFCAIYRKELPRLYRERVINFFPSG